MTREEFITRSAEETQSLGEACGRAARRGQVFALCGDLGAGKTQWVRGFARGAGFSGRVQSPTFGLVNVYEGGRLPVFHLDLYRLDTRGQIVAAGLEEYLTGPDGVAVVEWAERWFAPGAGMAPPEGGCVRLEVVSESERRIVHEHPGA